MSKNIEAKKGVVADIRQKFEKAQSAILVDYRGLNVAEDTELRNLLRKEGVEYAVLKNTMINLAVKDLGVDEVKNHLEGPTAVAFGYEDADANEVCLWHDKERFASYEQRSCFIERKPCFIFAKANASFTN